jgi:hypothetical protein
VNTAQHQHLGGDGAAVGQEIGRAGALQGGDGLVDFEGVAHGQA